MDKFHHFAAKLASYDHRLSSEDKVSKLIRTLPIRFAPTAMAAEASRVPFEKFIALIQAEISRQKTQGSNKNMLPVAATAFRESNNGRRRNQSKVL